MQRRAASLHADRPDARYEAAAGPVLRVKRKRGDTPLLSVVLNLPPASKRRSLHGLVDSFSVLSAGDRTVGDRGAHPAGRAIGNSKQADEHSELSNRDSIIDSEKQQAPTFDENRIDARSGDASRLFNTAGLTDTITHRKRTSSHRHSPSPPDTITPSSSHDATSSADVSKSMSAGQIQALDGRLSPHQRRRKRVFRLRMGAGGVSVGNRSPNGAEDSSRGADATTSRAQTMADKGRAARYKILSSRRQLPGKAPEQVFDLVAIEADDKESPANGTPRQGVTNNASVALDQNKTTPGHVSSAFKPMGYPSKESKKDLQAYESLLAEVAASKHSDATSTMPSTKANKRSSQLKRPTSATVNRSSKPSACPPSETAELSAADGAVSKNALPSRIQTDDYVYDEYVLDVDGCEDVADARSSDGNITGGQGGVEHGHAAAPEFLVDEFVGERWDDWMAEAGYDGPEYDNASSDSNCEDHYGNEYPDEEEGFWESDKDWEPHRAVDADSDSGDSSSGGWGRRGDTLDHDNDGVVSLGAGWHHRYDGLRDPGPPHTEGAWEYGETDDDESLDDGFDGSGRMRMTADQQAFLEAIGSRTDSTPPHGSVPDSATWHESRDVRDFFA